MADGQTQGTQTQAAVQAAPTAPGTDPAPTGQAGGRTFTQADVDAMIKDRLEREREAAQKKLAATYGNLDDLKKAAEKLQGLENAQKTEAEKLLDAQKKYEQQLADLQAQNAQLAKDKQDMFLRTAVVTKATTMNYIDPDDAFRLLDMAKVKVADTGEVIGLEDALKALATAKPHLVRGTPSLGATSPGVGQTTGETDDQRRARLFGGGATVIGRGNGGGVFNPSR